MASRRRDINLLIHPFVFVLKEGRNITKDYLNYSLMMLQVTCPEKISSPQKKALAVYPPLSENDILKTYTLIPPL